MTPIEQTIEMRHRVSERLGILAEDCTPTEAQIKLAESEAAEWKRQYLNQTTQGQRELL